MSVPSIVHSSTSHQRSAGARKRRGEDAPTPRSGMRGQVAIGKGEHSPPTEKHVGTGPGTAALLERPLPPSELESRLPGSLVAAVSTVRAVPCRTWPRGGGSRQVASHSLALFHQDAIASDVEQTLAGEHP
eukprot:scaffold3668_cov185-Pinguiococcus_pyrenoidosus.AAC.1